MRRYDERRLRLNVGSEGEVAPFLVYDLTAIDVGCKDTGSGKDLRGLGEGLFSAQLAADVHLFAVGAQKRLGESYVFLLLVN